MANAAINRIAREIATARKGSDLSIAVAHRDSDVRNLRALIIGPPETPYEFGFFEFDMDFPPQYPIKSPSVQCRTTNGGRCRFNPNIYSEGKVCLSILGTWRGKPGEGWSSAQGLESVLLSIQSLMSSNPYENEPGHETAKKDDPQPRAYIAKIRHETLRISVIQRLEEMLQIQPDAPAPESSSNRRKVNLPSHQTAELAHSSLANTSNASTPATEVSAYEYDAEAAYNALDTADWDPFADLMKRRFLWYHDAYIRAIETFSNEQKDGGRFKRCDFEFSGNIMEGVFEYKRLHQRLKVIYDVLIAETENWKALGALQVEKQSSLAVQLGFQFEQSQTRFRTASYEGPRIELSLPDSKNPFVWQITLFGEPMTNLDGGIFNMSLCIPPEFPDTQPRLLVRTPIFHHRVSSGGFLCYVPQKETELNSHIEAIIAAIGDNEAVYDPRTMVNPESFDLYWGGDDKRKVYNRKLRRSAEASCEFL